MGTEIRTNKGIPRRKRNKYVKLNNPLMGTEIDIYRRCIISTKLV